MNAMPTLSGSIQTALEKHADALLLELRRILVHRKPEEKDTVFGPALEILEGLEQDPNAATFVSIPDRVALITATGDRFYDSLAEAFPNSFVDFEARIESIAAFLISRLAQGELLTVLTDFQLAFETLELSDYAAQQLHLTEPRNEDLLPHHRNESQPFINMTVNYYVTPNRARRTVCSYESPYGPLYVHHHQTVPHRMIAIMEMTNGGEGLDPRDHAAMTTAFNGVPTSKDEERIDDLYERLVAGKDHV